MSLSPEEIEYFKEHASDSLQPSLIFSNAAGLILAYIFVGLRIWARKAGKVRFSYDDWLIVAALAPLSTYAIVSWLEVSFGEGKHIIFVKNVPGFIQGYVTCVVAYAICVVLTKLSILCFYCRIFFPIGSLFYISWGFGIFIVAYNVALIFATAFECVPLSSMWTGAPGTCFNTLPPFTALGIINVVTDVGILALPIRYVLPLHLTITRRIQVCGIFLLGAVVCVFGIIRVVALARAPKGDPSYNQVWSGVWSFCEIAVGIVAACLPTLAVLATKQHLSKISASAIQLLSLTFQRSRSSNGSNGSNGGGSARGFREPGSDDNRYAQPSEWSPARGRSSDSRNPIHEGSGDVSPFVTSCLTERGERSEDKVPEIMVKKEVIQTFQ